MLRPTGPRSSTLTGRQDQQYLAASSEDFGRIISNRDVPSDKLVRDIRRYHWQAINYCLNRESEFAWSDLVGMILDQCAWDSIIHKVTLSVLLFDRET